jgi:hypothetical protein
MHLLQSQLLSKFAWSAGSAWLNLVKCMVRRPTAREKLMNEESLRQCIRPVFGDVSPGHDEIRRVRSGQEERTTSQRSAIFEGLSSIDSQPLKFSISVSSTYSRAEALHS